MLLCMVVFFGGVFYLSFVFDELWNFWLVLVVFFFFLFVYIIIVMCLEIKIFLEKDVIIKKGKNGIYNIFVGFFLMFFLIIYLI